MLWQEEERCKIYAFHPSMRLNLFVPRIVLTTQQVAVSHCKAGKGIIKVNGRPLALVEVTPSPCFFRLRSFCIRSLIAFTYPPSVPHSSLQPPVLRAKLIEPISVLGLQVNPASCVIFPLCVSQPSINPASLRFSAPPHLLLVCSLAIFLLSRLCQHVI